MVSAATQAAQRDVTAAVRSMRSSPRLAALSPATRRMAAAPTPVATPAAMGRGAATNRWQRMSFASRPDTQKPGSVTQVAASGADKPPQHDERTLKGLVATYGSVALMVYASLSLSIFIACLSTVSYFDIQQKDVMTFTNNVLEYVKIDKRFDVPNDTEPEGASRLSHIMTKVAVAAVVTKFFTPLKFAATFAITPPLGRYLRSTGIISPSNVEQQIKNVQAKRRARK